MPKQSKRQKKNGALKNPPTPNVLGAEVPGGFKIKAAARYIGGVSVITMHRLINRGLLHPNRALRHLIFPKTELDRFLADHMT